MASAEMAGFAVVGTFAAGLARVLPQAPSHWRPSAVDRGKSLNQLIVLLLTPVLCTGHHQRVGQGLYQAQRTQQH